MNRSERSRLGILLLSILIAPLAAAQGWEVDDLLKQIDKATRGTEGLVGQAEFTDQSAGSATGSVGGEVKILIDGKLRVDSADGARSVLCDGSKMYVYEPGTSTVTEYKLRDHPDKLAQYTLIGFSVRGKDLEKDHLVTIIGEEQLDGRSVVVLELTPRKDALRRSISKVRLWIDQANWLPLQQRFFHGGAETHLTVRYSGLSRNDNLSNDPFKAKWPKGTIKKKG